MKILFTEAVRNNNGYIRYDRYNINNCKYIYTVPRMNNEIQDVRTAIANKQKIIMIDTSYLWASQINRLHKELIEAGYTQDSWLVFIIKEE